MKKIMTLAVAAAMLIGGLSTAHAIDFKAKGQWIVSADSARTAISPAATARRAITAAKMSSKWNSASASSWMPWLPKACPVRLYFEIGDHAGARALMAAPSALTEPASIEVKQAYIDWMVPQTDLKLRMGIQGMALAQLHHRQPGLQR